MMTRRSLFGLPVAAVAAIAIPKQATGAFAMTGERGPELVRITSGEIRKIADAAIFNTRGAMHHALIIERRTSLMRDNLERHFG